MDLHDSCAAEQAVLSVLAGTSIEDTAARLRTSPTRLAEAVELYRAAGRAALDAQPLPSGWHQTYIEYTDYLAADRAFRAHLLPCLRDGVGTGLVGGWWFLRKRPCWRLRVQPGPGVIVEDVIEHITDALDSTVSSGLAKRWWPSLYEPETVAFGGPDGMEIGHTLFHDDSVGVLDYLQRMNTDPAGLLDAKATSFLVITLFLRAAGQEWAEQGDVWARIETTRPLPAEEAPAEKIVVMADTLRRLLMLDAGAALAVEGPLASLSAWTAGMERGGRALADAGREGRLSLGLRSILARHVLFHWNRMGFTSRQQAIWARVARQAILGC
ncbi:thiopeptide-type bacteriocin biosynthesis protein [Peterkaempfera bronchialis]|uniref:Bacteriocin biosynthesis protein n=1 Tax=Peterkaempfera bronchialis TaxID=2126346 RepID=A0A345SZ27_9ACTN|nr:thiopeptide-type bacteriocin biosynthesis protein [Peterkaempfera bronchialis]AXI78982.1 bacteriocin biosynthesis protein [Peterkaempfera bronchialis]